MEKQRKKQCEEGIKIICAKYRLKLKEISNNEIAICAKNSAKKWVEWIKFNFDKENIIVNKEQCSLLFCDIREDITPDLLLDFVADINTIARKFDTHINLQTIITAKDWQEIAKVYDAYEDNRYQVQFKDIDFKKGDKYLYFTIVYEKKKMNGLFRVHHLIKEDLVLECIDCYSKNERNFVNAHWEEIEEKLCNYVKEKQNEVEKHIEKDIFELKQIYTKTSQNYVYIDKQDILDFFDYDCKLIEKITNQYDNGTQYKLELEVDINKELSEFRLYSKAKEEKQYIKSYEGKLNLDSVLYFLCYSNYESFLMDINDSNDIEEENSI